MFGLIKVVLKLKAFIGQIIVSWCATVEIGVKLKLKWFGDVVYDFESAFPV